MRTWSLRIFCRFFRLGFSTLQLLVVATMTIFKSEEISSYSALWVVADSQSRKGAASSHSCFEEDIGRLHDGIVRELPSHLAPQALTDSRRSHFKSLCRPYW